MRRLVLLLAAAASIAAAPVHVDPYRYDPATHCVKRIPKGMLLLQRWLEKHVRGESWGILRCEMWGKHSASLHAEGRAIDWHLDARVRADRRAAHALIDRLLASHDGEPYALARRMGVQGLIYNCQEWFGGGRRLTPYSYCVQHKRHRDPTQAHVNHVHIELNKAGAAARTSFWRGE